MMPVPNNDLGTNNGAERLCLWGTALLRGPFEYAPGVTHLIIDSRIRGDDGNDCQSEGHRSRFFV